MRTRIGSMIVAGLLGALLWGLAAPAHAQDPPLLTYGRQIVRYDVLVDLERDGTAQVTIDMDFSFGNEPGHGPYLWLPTRVGYDDEQDRLYKISRVRASSSTGAPAQVHLERGRYALTIRVGDEDRGNIRGVQQYTISYRLEGMVNGAAGAGTFDEFYWNAIGDGWEIPIANASVTVRGPGEIADATCFAGPRGSTEECTRHSFDGASASFFEAVLPAGRMFSVVTGWPAGTFEGVEPILARKLSPLDPVDPATPAGIAGIILLLGGVGAAVTRVRMRGRDEAYLGLTPGLVPGASDGERVGKRDRRLPVAVQFEPPRDVRPGAIGTLIDEVADPHDVTATLVDLAVRGYLRIDEVPRKNPKKRAKDWNLVRLKDADAALAPFEAELYHGVFSGRDQVRLSSLKTTFSSTMAKVQSGLYTEVTGRGWFHADPQAVRGRWRGGGGVLVLVGIVGGIFGAAAVGGPRGFVLIPIAILLVGITLLVCAKYAPARTAAGTAVLAQTLGFKQFISTAEANQLRWEEGEDLFSRYLPYAIAFGETQRWAKVFEDLAAQGRTLPEPTWYAGHGIYQGSLWASTGGLSSSLATFTSTATTSISAPTPGSSGGSGFSGGGGSSGGGGGGGGGGGW